MYFTNDQLNQGYKDILIELQKYEQKYGMLSEEFYQRYLNDINYDDGTMDWIEWSGLYQNKLIIEEELLKRQIQNCESLPPGIEIYNGETTGNSCRFFFN